MSEKDQDLSLWGMLGQLYSSPARTCPSKASTVAQTAFSQTRGLKARRDARDAGRTSHQEVVSDIYHSQASANTTM